MVWGPALVVAVFLDCCRMCLDFGCAGVLFVVPHWLLLAAFVWVSYRLVNFPSFADFLIAVEAEMNKVSWPTRVELFRSSIVVLIMMFAFSIFLAGCDIFLEAIAVVGIGHSLRVGVRWTT